jgi:short subunit dehydrogenase-like uncharacterized protein
MKALIYGAYGYTGELIAREACERSLDIVVAGRNGTKTRGLGIQLGVESRVFDPEEADSHLDDIDTVLNCAGPFASTYRPIATACLDAEAAYLDITGELPVFEALAELDRDAEEAGVPLLPGVGFDVVPTDCLACHLHDRLPTATHLRLGIEADTTPTGGTLASALEHAEGGGAIRRGGALEQVPVASETREIDFGTGRHNAVNAPLADVSTAYYTTGIENIDTYISLPDRPARIFQYARPLTSLLRFAPLKRGLQRFLRWAASGPSVETRQTQRTYIWGEVTDGERTVVSRLETPEPYTLTIDSATTALQRLAAMDERPTGFETPAVAFDADFVLGLDGVEGFHDEAVDEDTAPEAAPTAK